MGSEMCIRDSMATAAAAVTLATALLLRFGRDIFVQLQENAITDPLTGIFNRRGFELALEESLDRGPDMPISLILCDIDAFKRINDHHGHAVGDEVIARVAEIFEHYAGSSRQVACRLGGEEFALAIIKSRAGDAVQLAETIRQDIACQAVRAGNEIVRCTASFGVAQRIKGESLRSLLVRADRALYTSKEQGRNRVSLRTEEAIDQLKSARWTPRDDTARLTQTG